MQEGESWVSDEGLSVSYPDEELMDIGEGEQE